MYLMSYNLDNYVCQDPYTVFIYFFIIVFIIKAGEMYKTVNVIVFVSRGCRYEIVYYVMQMCSLQICRLFSLAQCNKLRLQKEKIISDSFSQILRIL